MMSSFLDDDDELVPPSSGPTKPASSTGLFDDQAKAQVKETLSTLGKGVLSGAKRVKQEVEGRPQVKGSVAKYWSVALGVCICLCTVYSRTSSTLPSDYSIFSALAHSQNINDNSKLMSQMQTVPEGWMWYDALHFNAATSTNGNHPDYTNVEKDVADIRIGPCKRRMGTGGSEQSDAVLWSCGVDYTKAGATGSREDAHEKVTIVGTGSGSGNAICTDCTRAWLFPNTVGLSRMDGKRFVNLVYKAPALPVAPVVGGGA